MDQLERAHAQIRSLEADHRRMLHEIAVLRSKVLDRTRRIEEASRRFIQSHRRFCWEAELEGGEFCIGENAVNDFLRRIAYER